MLAVIFGERVPLVAVPKLYLCSIIPTGCASPDISFKEVVSVFLAGRTCTKALSRGETTIEGFLERAAARLADLGEAQGESIEWLVDPASSVQPSGEFCDPTTLVRPGI